MGSILMKGENMENRMRLKIAALLLIAAAAVLSGITYAWFTISTVPEIRAVLTRVTTNGNLEIALGGVEPPAATAITDGDITELKELNRTWGNIVDLNSDVYTQLGNLVLLPVYKSDSGFALVEYGPDGRADSLSPLQFSAEPDEDGISIIRAEGTETGAYLYFVHFWLRASAPGDVVLVTEEDVPRVLGEPGTAGHGSTMVLEGEEGIDESLMVENDAGETPYNLLRKSLHVVFLDAENNEISSASADNDGRLVFDEDSNPYVVRISADQKDQPIRLGMCVYLEGEDLTNAEMGSAVDTLRASINLQFALDTELIPMDEPIQIR